MNLSRLRLSIGSVGSTQDHAFHLRADGDLSPGMRKKSATLQRKSGSTSPGEDVLFSVIARAANAPQSRNCSISLDEPLAGQGKGPMHDDLFAQRGGDDVVAFGERLENCLGN